MKRWKFVVLLTVVVVIGTFPRMVNAGTFSFVLQSTARALAIDYEGTGTITHMNSPQDPPTRLNRGRTSLEDINVMRATDLRVLCQGGEFSFSLQIGQPGNTFARYGTFFPGIVFSPPPGVSAFNTEHRSTICSPFSCDAVLSLTPTQANQLQALIDTHGADNLFLAGDISRSLGSISFSVVSALKEVEVDVKPGSSANNINPNSRGVTPVAILTTEAFDASTVNWTAISFGVTGMETTPVHAGYEDVDADGDIDLILHFNTRNTGMACGESKVYVRGSTMTGQLIGGRDEVVTVGCK